MDSFPRKSKTGNQPPICHPCRSGRGKEVRLILRGEGVFGWKEQKAAQMIHNPTPAEAAMAALLKKHRISFAPQVVLFGFIADFHLQRKGVIIEVDGGYHLAGDQAAYDRGRDSIFYDRGFRTLRLTNDQVLTDPDGSIAKVRETLAKPRLVPMKSRRLKGRDRVIARGRAWL
jgi:very-short-patch-repair endonuclease